MPIIDIMSAAGSFKESNSFDKRCAEATRIKEKFPGRYPIIVEMAAKSSLPDIDRKKFLVPGDLTVGQLIYVIRKRLILPPEKAMFVFCANTLPVTSQLIREVYNSYRDIDGFLYLTYTGESTFG